MQSMFEDASPETDPVDQATKVDVDADAMAAAGRLLGVRARTEQELRVRLVEKGHDDATIERTIARLIDLGLVDDRAFARAWVEERIRTRALAPEALIAELEAKGVDRSVAEDAIAEIGLDEEAQARTLALTLAPKWASLPLRTQASRLMGALLRRGYSTEAARAGIAAALPPEGWD